MKKVMRIEGMMCTHCSAHVKKALEAIEGVTAAEIDLENKTAAVTLEKDIPNDTLTAAVAEAGYTPVSVE